MSVTLQNMKVVSNGQLPIFDPVVQASAASLANIIYYGFVQVSGTNAMTGCRLPRGFRGLFGLIPTAAFTGATGGALAYGGTDPDLYEDIPFGKAFTAVAGKLLLMVSDGALIYPSYTA